MHLLALWCCSLSLLLAVTSDIKPQGWVLEPPKFGLRLKTERRTPAAKKLRSCRKLRPQHSLITRACFEQAIEITPDALGPRYQLYGWLRRRELKEEALDQLLTMIEMTTPKVAPTTAFMQLELVGLLALAGKVDAALSYMEETVNNDPFQPYAFAIALSRAGRTIEARHRLIQFHSVAKLHLSACHGNGGQPLPPKLCDKDALALLSRTMAASSSEVNAVRNGNERVSLLQGARLVKRNHCTIVQYNGSVAQFVRDRTARLPPFDHWRGPVLLTGWVNGSKCMLVQCMLVQCMLVQCMLVQCMFSFCQCRLGLACCPHFTAHASRV
jgi:hypothetical protein